MRGDDAKIDRLKRFYKDLFVYIVYYGMYAIVLKKLIACATVNFSFHQK